MGLIRFILIIFLIYYFFQLLISYVIPFFLKRYITKKQNTYYGQNTDFQKKKSGKVNIDYSPDKNKKEKNDHLGEYVDYEEIKD